MAEDAAVRLGGAWWRVPAESRVLATPPLRRPLPGGGALGLAEGRLVPALDPAGLGDARCWVALGGVLLAVEEFAAAAPAGAAPLPDEFLAPAAPAPMPRLAAVPAVAGLPGVARAGVARAGPAGLSGLSLRLGGVALTVPAALAERILPWLAPPVPVPAAPPGVLGYALAGGRPVLVLDLGWCAGGAAGEAGAGEAGAGELLAVLGWAGRRFALPCDRVATVAEPGAGFRAWLEGAAARRALAEAPAAAAAVPALPEPRRGLLLCSAAGRRFAVPAEEVAAVIAPQRPLPAPAGLGARVRGVCAHRGDVLPVLDAGESMGGPPALAAGPVPLLRLPGGGGFGPAGLAVAVRQVHGLRQVAVAACTAVADPAGLVAAVVEFEAAPLPILRLAGLVT